MEAAAAAIASAAAAAAAARRQAAQQAAAASAAAQAASARQPPRVRAAEQATKKKAEMLDHLLRSLDIVTYCHFAYVYFMDTSLLRFLIRSVTQINMFAQRSHPSLPVQRLNVRNTVITITGVTMLCLIFHTFGSAPFAGEASGGYIHGGLIIDFIGQEGPISKYRLILFDLLILLLQLLMLSIKSARQELSDKIQQRNFIPTQDHDSEERGVTAGNHENEAADNSEEEEEEQRRFLEGEEEGPTVNEPNLYSGEIVIAHLNVIDTIRRQWGVNSNGNGEDGGGRGDVEEASRNLREQLRARWGGRGSGINR